MHHEKTNFHIAGEIDACFEKGQFAELLKAAGLHVQVGAYAVRIQDCSHFVFQEFGLRGGPVIDADADSLDQLSRDGELVSKALTHAGIRHRFELYNTGNEQVGYLHFAWPPRHDA